MKIAVGHPPAVGRRHRAAPTDLRGGTRRRDESRSVFSRRGNTKRRHLPLESYTGAELTNLGEVEEIAKRGEDPPGHSAANVGNRIAPVGMVEQVSGHHFQTQPAAPLVK